MHQVLQFKRIPSRTNYPEKQLPNYISNSQFPLQEKHKHSKSNVFQKILNSSKKIKHVPKILNSSKSNMFQNSIESFKENQTCSKNIEFIKIKQDPENIEFFKNQTCPKNIEFIKSKHVPKNIDSSKSNMFQTKKKY